MTKRRKTVQRDPFGRELSTHEEEEEDAILKDGQSVRVALYMKDGAINPNLTPTQRAKAVTHAEDAIARKFGLSDGLALHRPGYRRCTDSAALARTRQAYRRDVVHGFLVRGLLTALRRAGADGLTPELEAAYA